MSLIVFDIDGTLADCSHRLHHIESRPKNWKAFFSLIPLDKSIEPMIELLTSLARSKTIVLATGRPEYTRSDTEAWLDKYIGLGYIDRIYMRTDYRTDDDVKRDMALKIMDNYETKIEMWFDDKDNVIQRLRKDLGLFVVDVNQSTNYGPKGYS